MLLVFMNVCMYVCFRMNRSDRGDDQVSGSDRSSGARRNSTQRRSRSQGLGAASGSQQADEAQGQGLTIKGKGKNDDGKGKGNVMDVMIGNMFFDGCAMGIKSKFQQSSSANGSIMRRPAGHKGSK